MNALSVIAIIIAVFLLFWIVVFFFPRKVMVSGIPKGFSEKRFKTDDVELNYIEGPENGPPLLLVPGQMECWQGYKAVMPELAKTFHVFSIDQRGHGKSSRTSGRYSYNIVGNDLKDFLTKVVKKPAIVSGLSSGGVLVVWLAANAPQQVAAIISEDPPMFSSMWPRITQEKYMANMFQNAIDTLGNLKGRDLEAYLSKMGAAKEGMDELLFIPTPVVKIFMMLFNINKFLKPNRPYDIPFIPFKMRVGIKFFMEYDVDFSRATLDGRLSKDFDPEAALKKVKCPMLLLQANWSRHPTWGLLGAMDERDVKKIQSLVKDIHYAQIKSGHGIHVGEPEWYIDQVNSFVRTIDGDLYR